jgi:hypothetical protein
LGHGASRAERQRQSLGLFDLDPQHPAGGTAYKKLIKDWRDVLPASSLCLSVPM